MPLGHYKTADPFDNHPLFKTEEQARLEETMDGEESAATAEHPVLAWPGEETAEQAASRARGRPLGPQPRLRLGRLARKVRLSGSDAGRLKMKRVLLGFGLAAGIAYALREWFAAPQPQPSWDETDNDPEDLSQDLAQRAREAEGAQATEETSAG